MNFSAVHRKNCVVESMSLPFLFLHDKYVFVRVTFIGRRVHEFCSLFLTSGALQFEGIVLWMWGGGKPKFLKRQKKISLLPTTIDPHASLSCFLAASCLVDI